MHLPALRTSLAAVATALFVSACTLAPVQPVALPLVSDAMVGSQWIAVTIDGVIPVVQPRPSLRWMGVDQVAGNGGCNGFTGKVTLNGDRSVRFGALAATGKACLTAPTGQEDLFFKALEQTRSAQLENGDLVLLDQNGKVLARLIQTNIR
jgi:putative lipoprotein